MLADPLQARTRLLEKRFRPLVRELLRLGFTPEHLRRKSLAELEDLRDRAYRDLMAAPKSARAE